MLQKLKAKKICAVFVGWTHLRNIPDIPSLYLTCTEISLMWMQVLKSTYYNCNDLTIIQTELQGLTGKSQRGCSPYLEIPCLIRLNISISIVFQRNRNNKNSSLPHLFERAWPVRLFRERSPEQNCCNNSCTPETREISFIIADTRTRLKTPRVHLFCGMFLGRRL